MDDSKIRNSTYPQTQQTSWGSKLLGRTKDVGMEGHARELAPGSMKVKAPQLCPTPCDLPASSVHGILQARILEWVAYPFSRGSSWPRGLLHCRLILYQLSYQGSPIANVLTLGRKMVSYKQVHFSVRVKSPRDWAGHSCGESLHEIYLLPSMPHRERESASTSGSVVSDSVIPWTTQSMEFSRPGQNTRVGSLSLLQGIFPTQGSNPGLPHCRQILYQLSHKGSLRILEWAAYPFSSRSFQPRSWTKVPALQAVSLPTELSGKPHWEHPDINYNCWRAGYCSLGRPCHYSSQRKYIF